jgi:hypothetical protein
MEAFFLQRSSVAEAGVTGEALLEGAATGTTLALPYCRYLLTALLDAVSAASDETIYQPQLNKRTVFADTWYEGSLARLANADIANLWRLTDYLMLDTACLKCLEDVIVQRQLRSGIVNQLLPASAISPGRRADMLTFVGLSRVAKGLAVPTPDEL